ncbi:MAG: hypothetical protein QOE99_1615 [Actinomycetota bacterium]|nr:hypothetical protein [Actinomycetota bacterium]
MNAEDRLHAVLHAEADDLVPAGDGLDIIRGRLDARRSLRARLLPVAALAGVAAVVAAAAVTFSATRDDDALDTRLGHNGPSAPATPTPAGLTTSGPGTPVWPFTTDAQAAEWKVRPGSREWAADPVQVVQHLLDDYLKLPGTATTRLPDKAADAVVEVSAGGRLVSHVHVVKVGEAGLGPWSVTHAESDNLSVTSPKDGDDVTSPLTVTGTVPGVDESVHLQLLADTRLAEGFAPAGHDQPWTHLLSWPDSSWSVAALAGSTFNGNGDLSAITITAVRRAAGQPAGPQAAGSTVVAVDAGHVVSVDATTGRTLRQVSYPGTATDGMPDRGGDNEVVWVRRKADGCSSAIVRAGAQGTAGFAVPFTPRAMRLPSLSAEGTRLGWVDEACDGSQALVIVSGPTGHVDMAATATGRVTDLDLRDDGTALVQEAGGFVRVVPLGATAVADGLRLVPGVGCTLAAPAWDDQVAIAWEQCGTEWRLARFTAAGRLAERSAPVSGISSVAHTAVDAGQVLLVLADGSVARLVNGALEPLPLAKTLSDVDW